MTTEENICLLMETPKFLEKLFSAEAPEDVQALLLENGVDFSIKEIEAIGRMINGMADMGSELLEDELENIAGGGNLLFSIAMNICDAAADSASDVFRWRTFTRW